MKSTLSLLLVMAWIFTAAQDKEPGTPPVKAGYGEKLAQSQPEFPGGSDSLHVFIRRTMRYPKQAIQSGARGKVWMGFIVDPEGKLKEESILKSVNKEFDEEALRIVKLMPPWKPATLNGTPVEMQYILQIEFVPPGQKAPQE